MKKPLRFLGESVPESFSLVVGWSVDAGRLGAKTTDYLVRKLDCQVLAEIEPMEFFPLGGVTIEDEVVQFPESTFYVCPGKGLVIFRSTPPSYEWYKFLKLVLDAAEQHGHLGEIYTIGGMVSLAAHTVPRQILGTFNSPELQNALGGFDFVRQWDYETPPGQRPTLSSYLLWLAKQRNVRGVSLWAPVPFYMVAVDDMKAQKSVLEFFDRRFGLNLDFSDIDQDISQQNQMIAELRSRFPDVDKSINRLESNLGLSEEESQRLVEHIESHLRGRS